jgi:hypothetical protein
MYAAQQAQADIMLMKNNLHKKGMQALRRDGQTEQT